MSNYRVTYKDDTISHEKKTGVFGSGIGRQGEDSIFPFVYGPSAKPGTWHSISAKDVTKFVGMAKDTVSAMKSKVIAEGKKLGYDVADGDIEVKSDGHGGVRVKINERPRKLSAEQKTVLRSRIAKHDDFLAHRQVADTSGMKKSDAEAADKATKVRDLLKSWDNTLATYNKANGDRTLRPDDKATIVKNIKKKQSKILAQLQEIDPKTVDKIKDTRIV